MKTARKPYNLLCEVGKPHSDILVLARYHEDTTSATFLGWEFDSIMVQCPKDYFNDGPYPVLNHYKARSELRPMSELRDWIRALRNPQRLSRQVPF